MITSRIALFATIIALTGCGSAPRSQVATSDEQESYSYALAPGDSELIICQNREIFQSDATVNGDKKPIALSGVDVQVLSDGTIFASSSNQDTFPLAAIGPSEKWLSKIVADKFLRLAMPRLKEPELWAVRAKEEKETTTMGTVFLNMKIVRITNSGKEIPLNMPSFDFMGITAGCEGKEYLYFHASNNFGVDTCIWRCNLDGSNLKQLTKEGFSIYATANGERGQIAYASNSKQTANWSIVLANENGKDTRVIEMGKTEVGQIRFSNSGKSLLALTLDGSEISLVAFDVATLEKRLIRRLK